MSEVTNSVLDARAAGAYARAEALVPSGPVRPADAVRPRFAVSDGAKTGKAADAKAAPGQDAQGQASTGTVTPDTPRSQGPGLLGGLTNFLARVFAQDGEAGRIVSSVSAAFRAYARTASATPTPTEPAGVEVTSPGFPRLSSGRAVDLVV